MLRVSPAPLPACAALVTCTSTAAPSLGISIEQRGVVLAAAWGQRQEPGALGADIDEAGIHPLEHGGDPAQHDVAHGTRLGAVVEQHLHQAARLAERDPEPAAGAGGDDLVDHRPPPSGPRPKRASNAAVSWSGSPTTLE